VQHPDRKPEYLVVGTGGQLTVAQRGAGGPDPLQPEVGVLGTERVGPTQRRIGEKVGRQSEKFLIQTWHNG